MIYAVLHAFWLPGKRAWQRKYVSVTKLWPPCFQRYRTSSNKWICHLHNTSWQPWRCVSISCDVMFWIWIYPNWPRCFSFCIWLNVGRVEKLFGKLLFEHKNLLYGSSENEIQFEHANLLYGSTECRSDNCHIHNCHYNPKTPNTTM